MTNIVNETLNNTNIFTNTNFEVVFVVSNTMDHNLRKKAVNTNKWEEWNVLFDIIIYMGQAGNI
jgi:hypothetical protein